MHPQIRGSPPCQVRSQIIRHHLDSLLSKAKIYPCMPAYFFICSCYFLLEELQDKELLLEDSPWFLFIPALRLSSDPFKSIFSYPALWCWARSFANEAFHFASWVFFWGGNRRKRKRTPAYFLPILPEPHMGWALTFSFIWSLWY